MKCCLNSNNSAVSIKLYVSFTCSDLIWQQTVLTTKLQLAVSLLGSYPSTPKKYGCWWNAVPVSGI